MNRAPLLKFENIDRSTLLSILKGVTGEVSVKLVVTLGASRVLHIFCNQSSVSELEFVVESFKGQETSFSLFLSEAADFSPALTLSELEGIKAPLVSREEWEKMPKRRKQALILRTIQKHGECSLGELATMLRMARSHVSNILNGKRGYGWGTTQKILNLPLTDEMKRMVLDASAGPVKG